MICAWSGHGSLSCTLEGTQTQKTGLLDQYVLPFSGQRQLLLSGPSYIYSFEPLLYFYFCFFSFVTNQSIHWHVQNAVIPCRAQEPLPFLPVIHFFVPLLSADHSCILPHFIQPSVSWSTSWSCCFQIHIQYSFGNPIFFHSLYMHKPT